MGPAWKSIEENGPRSEDQSGARKTKVSYFDPFEEGKVTQCRKNGKTRNDGEHAVCNSDDTRVENGRLAARAM